MTDPTDLRVEFEPEPINVEPDAPRFSWRVETHDQGATQFAYRVLVSRTPDTLLEEEGDVWDSGKKETSRSTNVAYDGPSLESDATYHWTVRVWDGDGTPSDWSEPTSFSTALSGADWDGCWIAHQPGVGDSNGYRSAWRADNGEEWVEVDLGEARSIASIELFRATPETGVPTPDGARPSPSFGGDDFEVGIGTPDAYRIEVTTGAEGEGREVIVEEETDGSPLRHDVDVDARFVRVVATDLYEYDQREQIPDGVRHDEVRPWYVFALAALAVRDAAGTDLARGRPVSASSSIEEGGWSRDNLVDGAYESQIASSSPLLRTSFELRKPIARARLHVASLGYGEAYVNGERLGDRVLDPAWTRYDERICYATYDVTDHLQEGENALGIWLGRGWFVKTAHLWTAYGSPRAIGHLTVSYEDGTERTVATDTSWRAVESPIEENDIYEGERYDARRERPGWAEPDFNDGGWDGASRVESPGGELVPERIEPMRAVETFEPSSIDAGEDGPIVDFGQNLTGWVELAIEGADAGSAVELRHAEALTDDGELSRVDLRSADATDVYVARGDEREVYEPRFTYHGFRYAQVVGYPGELDPEAITAKAIHTAMDVRGSFACSNEELVAVQHACKWGLRGNTHSIPEDCPQRDERLGWTGDAQIAARALLYNFDAVRFHEKWLDDHADCASSLGYVGDVIPNQAPAVPADPTWSITRVMIPWYLYLHDGDEGVLERHYEGMARYVEYWDGVAREHGDVIPDEYGKYGDWLAFENVDGRRGLPHDLFNSAFHYQVVSTFAKIADALGRGVDARKYRDRRVVLREAFDETFYDSDAGIYGPGTQSALAVPLFVGLVPDEREDEVVEALAEKVRSDGSKLQTGFLGTRPLLFALAEHGYEDLAYEVASQPEQPGWTYMVRNGATTIWERWDSDEQVGSGMNSLNHSPFTFVSEWFFTVLAGIGLDASPGIEHVAIEPHPPSDLEWAEGRVETRHGELSSRWERTAAGLTLEVGVPWNTSASVRVPVERVESVRITSDGHTVWENGAPGSLPDGLSHVREVEDGVVFEVGSGSYRFERD